ncbi:MAG TPA: nickel-binding protein [Polyangiales bacterium]
MEHVIVERVFAEPVDMDDLTQRAVTHQSCYEMRRVKLLRTLLSRDRLRMVCEYLAPDAESVREANLNAGMPFERIWTAKLYEVDRGV